MQTVRDHGRCKKDHALQDAFRGTTAGHVQLLVASFLLKVRGGEGRGVAKALHSPHTGEKCCCDFTLGDRLSPTCASWAHRFEA